MKIRPFYQLMLLNVIILLTMPLNLLAQNLPPVVEPVSAIVDTVSHTVSLKYNIYDQEQDTLEISLALSSDNGETFQSSIDSVSGDIGWPVLPGTEKQITWYYSPEDINPDSSILSAYILRIIADDHLSKKLQFLADQVDSLNLKANMRAIIGIRNYVTGADHLANVKEYLKTRLSSGNLELIEQPFEHNEYSAENIIGMLPGKTDKNILYSIGGHYDTVETSPGADDNGSAVAGMLEVARIFADYQFRYSLNFVAFDLEEIGMYGSKEYVERVMNDSTDLQGMINLDMIGYYSNQPHSHWFPDEYEQLYPDVYNAVAADEFRGNFLSIIANTASSEMQAITNSCASHFVPQLKFYNFSLIGNGEEDNVWRRSDHAVFWDEGYKAIMLSDGGKYRNSIFHTPADTIGTLNFTFMTNIVKTAVAVMASLGEIQHYSVGTTKLEIFNLPTVCEQDNKIPLQYRLEQNYPNPFNPQTRIDYFVPQAGNIDIKVYTLTGQEVQTLVHKYHKAGTYNLNFNAGSLPCGMYLYTLQVDDKILECKKMLLIK